MASQASQLSFLENSVGVVTVANASASTSTSSGALLVAGGIGVGGNVNIGGTVVGGGIRTTSTSTPPANPTVGDVWYDTSSDILSRWTSDGTNSYWLDITGPTVGNLSINTVGQNIIPINSGTYDLGAVGANFRNLYVSTATFVGSNNITLTGSGNNLLLNNSQVVTTATVSAYSGPKITSIVVTSSTYVATSATAVSSTGTGYILINGNNFLSGAQVVIGGKLASSISVVNSSQLQVQTPAQANGTYPVYVTNTDGSVGIYVPGLTYNDFPAWSTGPSLTGQNINTPISIQLSATDSTGTVTYSVAAGSSLPPGLSLSSSGLLSGTVTGITSNTTYNFVVNATDIFTQVTAQTFSITITAQDPYWPYTTLLLHGDGVNGANNTSTFIDSSSNNFTITRNGSTSTQGTFSPYGTLWSNYFNGSTDYLATNQQINLGSGNYTTELWVYNNGSSSNQIIFDFRVSAGVYPVLYIDTSYKLNWVGNNNNVLGTSSSAITINTWTHIAVVRNSSTNTFYINGVASGTFSDSTSYNGNYVTIGSTNLSGSVGVAKYNGYMSNMRFVVGTAVYTSNFTPPTTPLTAITNTQLLTCQSNRFLDNSSNSYTFTITGTPSVQRFSPFNGISLYSTSTYGGSVYLSGNGIGSPSGLGDYLTTPTSSNLVLGSGNFTVECWFYNNSVVNQPIFSQSYSTGIDIRMSESANTLGFYLGSGTWYSISWTYSNQWTHIAVVRNGSGTNNVTMYVNGVSVVQTTNTTTLTANQWRIGTCIAGSANSSFVGYISDPRVVIGTAVYTGNFTPPTAPLTPVTNTQLLLNGQNAGIIDSTMINDLTTYGSAQISTGTFKVGTGSLYFNGTTDYLQSNSAITDLYAFNTGNFTIEMWFYVTGGVGTNTNLYDSTTNSGMLAPQIYLIGSPWTLRLYGGSAGSLLDSGYTITTGIWYHVAVCRSNGSTRIFINGTQQGSTLSDTNNYINGAQRPRIGSWGQGSGNFFNGYIDELRVTKGYARYTSNFTPSTGPFGNQ